MLRSMWGFRAMWITEPWKTSGDSGKQFGYALLAIQLVLGAVYTLLIKHNTARVECKAPDISLSHPEPHL